MSTRENNLINQIKKWVINDYFTPNIKAEVILDTLLSEYIHELKEGAELVAKEMSLPDLDKETFGSRGPKIDYVLADSKKVYLVELKTTNSSYDNQQEEFYSKYQDKFFGETLGRQLLMILDKKDSNFSFHLDCPERWGAPSQWNDETLRKVFQEIVSKERYQEDAKGKNCAEQAMKLIRAQNWTQSDKYRSRKYLYTLGQLVDYQGELWHKRMEIIYLAPDKIGTPEVRSESLKDFAKNLPERHPDDALAQLLADIVKEIYKTEEV